jgi:hypothetical protein
MLLRDVESTHRARSVASWFTKRAGARAALGAIAALAVGTGSSGRHALAQDDGEDLDRTVRNCINIMQVDHTKVIDDDTILFYMKNDVVYQNDLPNRCPALEQEETFMYRVSVSQLCDVDVITVLSDMGFGFRPMASCGLGKFAPIDAEAAEELEAAADEPRGRRR